MSMVISHGSRARSPWARARHAAVRPLALLAALFVAVGLTACSDDDGGTNFIPDQVTAAVIHWNTVAYEASGLDHTPPRPGENRVSGEQPGPGRASRALAIAQVAVFEAMNAIEGGYESYVGLDPALPRTIGTRGGFAPAAHGASLEAAIAQASHDALVALFPAQTALLNAKLNAFLAGLPSDAAKAEGIEIGRAAAAAALANRAGDGSNHPEPRYGIEYIASNAPGEWRQDPVSRHPLALGARWAEVRPFVLGSASQFRTPPPPALDSPEYAVAYNEVYRMGGDGTHTRHHRQPDQTSMGIYWAYDGTPSLCAPPKLYNQVAVEVALQQSTGGLELARLLALLNVGMADAGIAIWESKYHYKFWRPVGGIREGDADGNPSTPGMVDYMPLGAPASNLTGPNFTPPFPAYPSGHAGFGGVTFQTLRRFYGRDDLAFTFVSDEYNGKTLDNTGSEREFHPRYFPNFSEPEEENGQSRIYLGIHWAFDKTEALTQGERIADYVYFRVFRPTR
jgi:hypothetical protein